MFHKRSLLKRCFLLLAPLVLIFLFNEVLIYYLVIFPCSWPEKNLTNIMILADTHLLGIRNGHWFDKLRREWQMYRSFQSAMTLLQPNAVFFLGDIFDEGQWSSEKELQTYAKRFDSLFYVNKNVTRVIVIGNHDVGFHYAIRPDNLDRFASQFGVSKTVEHFTLNGNHFVVINSMAMERDGCRLCAEAEREILKMGKMFSCTLSFDEKTCLKKFDQPYSRPILLQHFPLYRESDEICESFPDLAPPDIIKEKFRERWECLSKESTDFLLDQLNPRAAFGGHVHFGCRRGWKNFYEYTVPSFSW
uniref:Calcineurin-like phosphoesterase domain-containing protein n=1 Tax=Acrobeloides nanus TaxID=290746 RepID=A0A914E157_9BILA